MTGDNQYVTRIRWRATSAVRQKCIVTGTQLDTMDDAALAVQAEKSAIFARVSPAQKNRATALKARGHVVGFLGDGINDAPSLHTADVGISVMSGVDVAKDAAKVILLDKDLAVLNDGIVEGRRSFGQHHEVHRDGHGLKFPEHVQHGRGVAVLPFLLMLPTQILLNNFLDDASQVSIPSDNVDTALLHRPKRWQISFIRQFMMIIGPISSLVTPDIWGVVLVFHVALKRAVVPHGLVRGIAGNADPGGLCYCVWLATLSKAVPAARY